MAVMLSATPALKGKALQTFIGPLPKQQEEARQFQFRGRSAKQEKKARKRYNRRHRMDKTMNDRFNQGTRDMPEVLNSGLGMEGAIKAARSRGDNTAGLDRLIQQKEADIKDRIKRAGRNYKEVKQKRAAGNTFYGDSAVRELMDDLALNEQDARELAELKKRRKTILRHKPASKELIRKIYPKKYRYVPGPREEGEPYDNTESARTNARRIGRPYYN